MRNKSLEYSCIFGGGAIRGVSYIGAIKALEELKINPNIISGSSVGAIVAGLVAVGYDAEELREIFMQVSYELFKDIHFGFGKVFALSKGEIFLDWLQELIEKKFYGERYSKGENPPVTFADLEKSLVIITTDLTNFKYKEFSKVETPDFEIALAIRISSTMPGLMKPFEYKDSLLVDGDLQKSWPLWRLSPNLCPDDERVLEFRLEGDYEGKGQNAIDFMNTVYSCVTSVATDFIIDTYAYKDKFDYVKINTGSVVVVDFNLSKEKREDLMDIGYNQTLEYFRSDLVEKKKELVKHYRLVAKYIDRIKKNVDSGKIKQAKEVLGDLYMNLYPARKYIDLKDYNKLDDFKEKFLADLNFGSIFGFYSLKNPKLIKTLLVALHIQFEEKVMELESYIFKI